MKAMQVIFGEYQPLQFEGQSVWNIMKGWERVKSLSSLVIVFWEMEITVQSFHRKETTLAHDFLEPIPAVYWWDVGYTLVPSSSQGPGRCTLHRKPLILWVGWKVDHSLWYLSFLCPLWGRVERYCGGEALLGKEVLTRIYPDQVKW